MPLQLMYGVTLTVEAGFTAATGVSVVLNANPFFETDTSDWAAGGAGTTIARSTAQAHSGSASLLLTPSGGVASIDAHTTKYPVVGGQAYVASAWVYCPVAWTDVRCCVDWYDVNGVFISSGLGSATSVGAGAWTFLTQTLTAPSNATGAVLRARVGSTPGATILSYWDEAKLMPAPSGFGLWDSALWDTNTWGPDVVWTDVSQWVRSVSTTRRFGRDVGAWEAGTATVVLNNRDGRFSADNMSGPYVTNGITQIRPWRPIRITAAYNGTPYPVYRGYFIDLPEQWPGDGFDATVTLSCVDELARLTNFDGLAQPLQGSGESSGDRIHRILNNAGHTGDRNIDSGRVTMQATNLSQNAVTELKLVADSEGGSLYIDADGTVVFGDQYDLLESVRSNATQATFGDSVGEFPYADLTMAYNGNLTKTIVAWSRANGVTQVALDNTSRALYGDLRDTTNTNLVCETDSQVLGLAQFQLAKVKDPERRIVGMTVLPRNNPSALFPQVLGRKVRDRIHVNRRPVGGYTISRDVFVSGVSHTITADNWVTNYEFASATPYVAFSSSLWDVGAFDSAVWFY